MDSMQIVLFASVITGIGIVIFALILMSRESGGNGFTSDNSYFDVDNAVKVLNSSIEEADKAAENLKKSSASVLQEIDGKYQELLFLYNLLDEKKKEFATAIDRAPAQMNHGRRAAIQSPKLKDINELAEKGFTVADIAKTLQMGQSEVKLILELSKSSTGIGR